MKQYLLTLFVLFPLLCVGADQAPTILFAHGLADTNRQAEPWRALAQGHTHTQVVAPNFPDATERFWRVNFPWTSLGQDNEIATIQQAHQAIADQPTILIGTSRGAATHFNFLALHKPKNIKAAIFESPYSSMSDVAQNIVERLGIDWIPYLKAMSPYMVGCIFWSYSYAGAHPIDMAKEIDTNIPLLFISSEQDHLVNVTLTKKLVQTLIDAGHTKVHHLCLTEGRHGKLSVDERSRDVCRHAIHAFYAHYNLPHDTHAAHQGMQHFRNAKVLKKD